MGANVNVAENAVPIGAAGTNQQVRNLTTNVLVGGVLTPVLMQVVASADRNGNILDSDLAKLLSAQYELLGQVLRELRIQNELTAQWFALSFPNLPPIQLDAEYRNDPAYATPLVT